MVTTLLFLVTLHAHGLLFIWTAWCFVCIVLPVMKKMVTVHLPSWEEAFRCSSRSQPNTFSLLPPFLRTLLISSCRLFSLHIQTGPGCSACDRQTDWLTVCLLWLLDVLTNSVKVTLILQRHCTFQRLQRAAAASVSASAHVVGYASFPQ